MNDELLIEKAIEATKFAYVPYSNFRVGSALLTKTGKIYTGCNIENSSYGATNCAERTAIFKAVSEGELNFEKIAIVNSKGGITQPCGICRQVMSEFMPDGKVILQDCNGNIVTYDMKTEILPNSFKL